MKTWIISISAIIILTSIFGLIIPESKIGKLIKSIFSILVVFVIAEIIHIIVCAIKRKKINFFNILRLALTGVSYYIFVKLFTSSF